jgi:hypothetical protein
MIRPTSLSKGFELAKVTVVNEPATNENITGMAGVCEVGSGVGSEASANVLAHAGSWPQQGRDATSTKRIRDGVQVGFPKAWDSGRRPQNLENPHARLLSDSRR